MVNWLFKKPGTSAAATPKPSTAPSAPRKPAGPTPQERAQAKASQLESARAEWAPRLQAAQGDDAALQRVASDCPLVDLKLAAIEAIAGIDALKQAERELRNQDRRAHRAAKQRLDAALKQRESRAHAATVLASAQALLEELLLPANRLVALDQAWQALDAELLETQQRSEFAALRERLNARLQQRAEQEQLTQRWIAQARETLAALRRVCSQGTAGPPQGSLTPTGGGLGVARPRGHSEADAATVQRLDEACAVARSLLDARPEERSTLAIGQELHAVLEAAAQLRDRLEALAAAPSPVDTPPAELELPVAAAAPRTASPEHRAALGASIEAAAHALADGKLRDTEGYLREADAMLDALRGLLPPGEPLRAKLQTLHGEFGRLKGWQKWGGGRARDEAVAQAEALARAALAAQPSAQSPAMQPIAEPPAAEPIVPQPDAQPESQVLERVPEAPTEAQAPFVASAAQAREAPMEAQNIHEPPSAVAPEIAAEIDANVAAARPSEVPGSGAVRRAKSAKAPRAPKLRLREHAQAIHELRQRWKELDRTGAPASQEQWRRFDAALRVANEPVAAQQAALKSERETNLLAREALLAKLEVLPDLTGPAAPPAASVEPAQQAPESALPDAARLWKERAHAIEEFQRAWRVLGPLEHTVPGAARSALQQRLASVLERLEAPLQEVRREAEAVRADLIARTEALAQEVAQQQGSRDVLPRLRELQAQWQHNARQVTLPRGVETALWERFKRAGDAVFAQRKAEANARDAQFTANVAAREALLARLTALTAHTPRAEIQRTLSEVDRAWREAGETPRAAQAALEARLRDAHAAALRALDASAGVQWQAQVDGLIGRLALCEQRESEGAASDVELAQRWAEHEGQPVKLPPAWQQALAQRWAQTPEAAPLADSALDELLLHLEASLDLPATPERMAARRALKLRALKDTLEGRGAPNVDAAKRATMFAQVLRSRCANAAVRERVQALLNALRGAAPGTLVAPAGRG